MEGKKMDFEMIINCKITCVWMRVRDKILHLVSFFLWAILLTVLFRIEAKELLNFITSFYLAMVFLVCGLLLTWSHYQKSVFSFVRKRQNRRARFTALPPKATAEYFFMEEMQVCALQREKSTIIQHGKDGLASSLLFHNYSLRNSASLKKITARFYAAA